ncbi:hypothetical protein [Micromonospora tulbaghiae]|uniref:hypothetical protein n=1 Tax=Micromonospora tulbaghiae TaxID=479978 RepID=UPI0034449A3D
MGASGWDYFAAYPPDAQAALDELRRQVFETLAPLAEQRWFGRYAVLHDDAGAPSELYFWGFSGD